MKRRQLFEFNDAPWLPPFLRAMITDYLRTWIEIVQPFSPQLPLIAQALRRAGDNAGIVDLCSGSGGPWRHLSPQLNRLSKRQVTVLLTDKYPNQQTTGYLENLENVSLFSESVDASKVPPELPGMRCCFDGFHQFEPKLAAAILRDAVAANQPIVVMEILRRSPVDFIALLFSPLLVWLLTPFIRPFSVRRLFFTYIFPVVPFLVTWDSVVSIIRCYTPQELTAMGRTAATDCYQWHTGTYRRWGMPVTFLIGYPLQQPSRGDAA